MAKNVSSQFKGLSTELQAFLIQLKANNNREWFESNKHFYENAVKEPLKQLVYEMSVKFADNKLPFVADPKRAIFRIYRDIRFSKNKEPYKTNIGVFFPFDISNSGKKPVNAPGLYFHADESDCFIAAGLHQPLPEQLQFIRRSIAENWEEFQSIINNKAFKKEFEFILQGESLKRVPQGYPQEHPAADYLKLKQFDIYTNIDIKLTQSPKLLDLLITKANAALPFLQFINC